MRGGASPGLRACEGRVHSATSGSFGWRGSQRRWSGTPGLHRTAGRRLWHVRPCTAPPACGSGNTFSELTGREELRGLRWWVWVAGGAQRLRGVRVALDTCLESPAL